MRRFMRTIAGKVTLIILFLLIVYTALAAMLGVIFCVDNGLYDGEDGRTFYIPEEAYRNFAIDRTTCALLGVEPDEDFFPVVAYKITDENGRVIDQGGDLSMELDKTITVYAGWNGDSLNCGPAEDEICKDRYIVSLSRDSYVGRTARDVQNIELAEKYRFAILGALIGSSLLGLVLFIALMSVSARRPGSEEVHPGYFNFIPTDLMLIPLVINIGLLGINGEEGYVALAILPVTATLTCFSITARIKDKSLVKNTVVYKILALIWKFFTIIPLIWKTLLITVVVGFYELATLASDDGGTRLGFYVVGRAVIIPIVIYFVYMLTKLKKSAKILASGDYDHRTDTKFMVADLKAAGTDLNSIASGMDLALQEKLKSERLKTELITNVSHDIKTPLTSIINYTDLISKEQTDNEKITEYTEVLTRQSDKLKRLIEDLVEASKASTGNIDVELMPCEASVFLTQCAGEFEDRFNKCELQQVVNVPDKEIKINADGRRMLRVFDNLMSNICKYSLPGTRVYLTLKEQNDKAVFEFKNTSKDALNMSEEELMERFTRGDKSRNTEGNGLGLSIARSLTELQGGKLNIEIDGDLFKAIIEMPKA